MTGVVLTRPHLDWKAIATAGMFAALIIGVFLPYYAFTPLRVGDGSEYYALFLAIKDDRHLWMTGRAFGLYDALFSTQSIPELVPVQVLHDSFPALRLGATADFNHFWIYSLLAAAIARAGDVVGLALSPHHAFVTLHLLLTLCAVWLAQALYGWRGAVAALALLLLSPMVWYFDKVHSEQFTVCLVLAAVMLAQARYLAWGAACLALASTQNPSFAIVALALLIWRVAAAPRAPLRFWELCAIVGTVLFALLHPAYYYFRHGVLTPQLLAGGAELGGNMRSFSVWLVDPDVGLLPNWPMSLVLLLIGAGLWVAKRRQLRIDWPLTLFIAGVTVVNLFAQSSTTNINSGATPGLARYALWYIPLFFPLALQLVTWLSSLALPAKVLGIAAGVTYLVLNAWAYDPRSGEDYTHPSAASKFVQTYLPALYDPPVEVFQERFSKLSESPASMRTLAIVGPSCDKLLLIPGPDHSLIDNSSKCLLDHDKIRALAEGLSLQDTRIRYIRLPTKGRDFSMTLDRAYPTSLGRTGAVMLGGGWHGLEDWGTWAAERTADLNIPCPRDIGAFRVTLTLSAFNEDRDASIVAANQTLWSGKVTASSPTDVTLTVKPDQCAGGVAQITLVTDTMAVPKTLGISNDERALSVGLAQIAYQ